MSYFERKYLQNLAFSVIIAYSDCTASRWVRHRATPPRPKIVVPPWDRASGRGSRLLSQWRLADGDAMGWPASFFGGRNRLAKVVINRFVAMMAPQLVTEARWDFRAWFSQGQPEWGWYPSNLLGESSPRRPLRRLGSL